MERPAEQHAYPIPLMILAMVRPRIEGAKQYPAQAAAAQIFRISGNYRRDHHCTAHITKARRQYPKRICCLPSFPHALPPVHSRAPSVFSTGITTKGAPLSAKTQNTTIKDTIFWRKHHPLFVGKKKDIFVFLQQTRRGYADSCTRQQKCVKTYKRCQ